VLASDRRLIEDEPIVTEHRNLWRTAITAGVVALMPAQASAQPAYPVKPVRFMTPTGAGGSLDWMTRLLAQRLSEAWRQQCIVDNRVGAGGMIATAAVAKAAPDGYTLLSTSNGVFATTQAMFKNVPYDPVRDFATIVLVGATPYVLVAHPSLPVQDVRGLIALAKARPKEINASIAGTGGTPHLATELLSTMAGIKLTIVPYRTSAMAVTGVVAGETSLMLTGVVAVMPLIGAKRLRALAVASDQRLSLLPSVPTIAEQGMAGYEASAWAGFMAPTGTPPAVISAVNKETLRILQGAETREAFKQQGFEVLGSTPEQFAEYVKREIVKWTRVVRDAGLTAQ